MRGAPGAHHYLPVEGGAQAARAEIERALTAALAVKAARTYARYRSLMALREKSAGGFPRGFRRRFKLWRKAVDDAIAIATDIARIRALARAFPAGLPLAKAAPLACPAKLRKSASGEISSRRRRCENPRTASKKSLPARGRGRGSPIFPPFRIRAYPLSPAKRTSRWRAPDGGLDSRVWNGVLCPGFSVATGAEKFQ